MYIIPSTEVCTTRSQVDINIWQQHTNLTINKFFLFKHYWELQPKKQQQNKPANNMQMQLHNVLMPQCMLGTYAPAQNPKLLELIFKWVIEKWKITVMHTQIITVILQHNAATLFSAPVHYEVV